MSIEKNRNQIFCIRIKEKMKSNSITQKELSLLAKVSQSAVSEYLKGDRVPRAPELFRISQALDCTMDWLWGGGEQTLSQSAAVKENIALRAKLDMIASALQGVLKEVKK